MNIPKSAKQIKNSTDYIDESGNVYSTDNRPGHKAKVFIRAQTMSHGYKYCNIRMINPDGSYRNITKRVHRLVAEAFIPNPNNYPIVMHLDNCKTHNNVNNLKWGTIQENTLQAYEDGLLTPPSNDDTKIPCDMYDTKTNKIIKTFESCHAASNETGISVGTILQQIKNPVEDLKKNYYFVKHGAGPRTHNIIIQYDFKTDTEVNRFTNCAIASKETNIPLNTIVGNIHKNKKPKFTKYTTYFMKVKI